MKSNLNQTQALAIWMKSGKWIDLNNAKSELKITRLPEIMRRLKEHSRHWNIFFEDKTVTVDSAYGKTHIKRWRLLNKFHYKQFLKEFCG